MGMGHTAEQVASKYGVSREDQDAFAVRSHERAGAAIAAGKFNDEIVPVEVVKRFVDENDKVQEKKFHIRTWMKVFVRYNVETLAKLRPAFNVRVL